ncbi:hypothetical protein [Denitrificimonas caeni]|uniref:Nucleotide-diphospho-sugar transferase n=1 Tax=Denitrificimonas caeni TaxID=521720 RepID=A0AAE9VMW0_9GAMM|nr:hypothetical protein [Denitrificimonas caeni]WBE25071.1 hypothetical protein O6P33_12035 [Denitrificimonas caeni]
MDIPVLLVFFNRPKAIFSLLKVLSKVKPKKVYLSCDGARDCIEDEKKLVESLRKRVIQLIDWDCELFFRFSEHNLGCKKNVSESVQWFFNNEAQGIVLEDDCIPSLSFFDFAGKMLEKYKDDKRIGSIAGRNEIADIYDMKFSHTFTRKFFCWGWASWSDRVVNNNIEIGYEKKLPKHILEALPLNEKLMLRGIVGLMQSYSVNSWAYPFDLCFRERNQLCVIPKMNLIKNIGLDVEGAHSKGKGRDILSLSDEFYIDCTEVVDVVNDKLFMDKLISKRYKGFLFLVLFSFSRYLYPIKKMLFK